MVGGQPRVTLVVDPRFSGGTSSAVASEIDVLSGLVDLRVAAVSSGMFKGQEPHPAIAAACRRAGIGIEWDPQVIAAEIVVLHNPSFLKFDGNLGSRIVADRLFVVCHENFLRPTGGEGFAVGKCLDAIRDASLCRRKYLAPISAWNRTTVTDWMANTGRSAGWEIAPLDWTNICAFDTRTPVDAPQDRRGRHSRPGFEKFPDMATLSTIYPSRGAVVRILGADSLLFDETPSSWDLIPFMGEEVTDFLSSIDFFVYFTNPNWRESFGRVIGEAIAAGKLVITDHQTASTFGPGVIGAHPAEVDGIVQAHVDQPEKYAAQVTRAQRDLQNFSADAFATRFWKLLGLTARQNTRPTSKAEEIYALM